MVTIEKKTNADNIILSHISTLISFGSSGKVNGLFKPQFERSKQQMAKEIICFILIFEI